MFVTIPAASIRVFLIATFFVGSNSERDGMHHTVTKHRGIITLYRHQKAAFAITSRRGPTPKATKAQIGDLPASTSGNVTTELDEVGTKFNFQFCKHYTVLQY